MANDGEPTAERVRALNRRRRISLVELAVYVVATVLVLWAGQWTGEELRKADCPNVLEFEFAVPDGAERGLPAIEELASECSGDAGPALRSAAERDFVFIAGYVVLLGWAGRRLGGYAPRLFGTDLAAIDRGHVVRQVGAVGFVFSILAGGLDVIENLGLVHTADHLAEPSDSVLWVTAGTAAAKWLLAIASIAIALVYLVRLVLSGLRSSFAGVFSHPETVQVDHDNRWACPVPRDGGPTRWELADGGGPRPGEHRLGVCLSGGGIRSATFGLGALQELERAPDGWNLRDARYLTAVSGGSYIAASYQMLAAEQGGVGDGGTTDARDRNDTVEAPGLGRRMVDRTLRVLTDVPLISGWAAATLANRLTFDLEPDPQENSVRNAAPAGPLLPPGGNVERHIRRNAFHLADGAGEWLRAVGEVLLKAGSALLLVLLAVWVVGLPLGWAYRDVVHGLERDAPELWFSTYLAVAIVAPFVLFVALRLAVSAAELLSSPLSTRSSMDLYRDKGRLAMVVGVGLVAMVLLVVPTVALGAKATADWVGERVGLIDDPSTERDEAHEAVTIVIEGLTASAKAAGEAIDGAAQFADAGARAEVLDVALEDLRLAAERSSGVRAELAALDPEIDIDEQLPLRGLLDAETCEAEHDADEQTPRSLHALGCQALGAADETATALVDLVGVVQASGTRADAAAHAAAVGEVTVSAADAAAAASKTSTGVLALRDALRSVDEPGDPTKPLPIRWAALSSLLTVGVAIFAKRRLDIGARPGTTDSDAESRGRAKPGVLQKLGFGGAVEILGALLTVLLGIVVLADVIRDAWGRGPTGRVELVVVVDSFWTWLVAAGVLAVAIWRLNANTWSLRPFYHRRLWQPYAVTADGKTADWDTDTRLSVIGRRQPGRPELLVVAAVQVSGRDHAPPGRRAVPFVFSADACGGPEVGYVDTRTLEALLGSRHRHTVTLLGAVATSGAAFGPAMGRHSKGGLGAVLALVNARLGAWLPNPRRLDELGDLLGKDEPRSGAFRRWPDLTYWGREIFGQYSLDDRMILATDGGHYENLGLLELFRRRCTRILCFDASGAGATPTTLAEALVLAREELGVIVELDFPAADDAPGSEPTSVDPLGRRLSPDDADRLAERLAANPVVTGTIRYPARPGGIAEAKGRLVYGTLALADDPLDWDVLEYAQRHPEFPNDGTDRQWFRAEVFAAYHQLGRATARRMVATVADDET